LIMADVLLTRLDASLKVFRVGRKTIRVSTANRSGL
jgi:hypothetical protein